MPRSNPGRDIPWQKLPYLERGPASEGLPGPLPNPGREENGPKLPNLDIGTSTYRRFLGTRQSRDGSRACRGVNASRDRSISARFQIEATAMLPHCLVVGELVSCPYLKPGEATGTGCTGISTQTSRSLDLKNSPAPPLDASTGSATAAPATCRKMQENRHVNVLWCNDMPKYEAFSASQCT